MLAPEQHAVHAALDGGHEQHERRDRRGRWVTRTLTLTLTLTVALTLALALTLTLTLDGYAATMRFFTVGMDTSCGDPAKVRIS